MWRRAATPTAVGVASYTKTPCGGLVNLAGGALRPLLHLPRQRLGAVLHKLPHQLQRVSSLAYILRDCLMHDARALVGWQ